MNIDDYLKQLDGLLVASKAEQKRHEVRLHKANRRKDDHEAALAKHCFDIGQARDMGLNDAVRIFRSMAAGTAPGISGDLPEVERRLVELLAKVRELREAEEAAASAPVLEDPPVGWTCPVRPAGSAEGHVCGAPALKAARLA